MEPFTILCSTCQSRIRVRNPAMVGQIVNCPKCQAMIMIEKHEQVVFEQAANYPSPGEGVNSAAMTKDAIAAGELPDMAVRMAQLDPGRKQPGTDAGAGIDWTEVDQQADEQIDWQADAAPLVPNSEWTSQSTAKKRQFLLVGFLGLAGLAISAVLFIAFLQWFSKPSDSAVDVAQNGDADQSAQVDPTPADRDATSVIEATSTLDATGDSLSPSDPNLSDPNSQVPSADATNSADDTSVPGTSTAPPNMLANVGSVTPGLSPPGDLPSGDLPEQTDNAGSDTGSSEQPTTTLGDAANLDEGGMPSDADPADDAGEETANDAQQVGLPRKLEKFRSLLSRETELFQPDTPILPKEPPLTASELGIDADVAGNAVSTVNWQERSQTTIGGFIVGDQPLDKALNAWVSISGTPTVINFDSFSAAGISRTAKLKLQIIKTSTLGEIAQLFAAAAGALAEPQENRFLQLRIAPDALRTKLPPAMPIGDLVSDSDQESWLNASLEKLFPSDVPAWKIADGSIQVDLEQTDLLTWFSVLRLLENWRSQAGMPSRLEGYMPEAYELAFTEPAELQDALAKQLPFATTQPQPVGQVLSRVCEQAGLQCWIDWPEVASVDLGPETIASVVTNARQVGHVLKDIAGRYRLVIVMLDKSSLWITSARGYRTQTQVYVLPSQGKTLDQWRTLLREYTPAGAQGIGNIDIAESPNSEFIFVRCCRPVVSLR